MTAAEVPSADKFGKALVQELPALRAFARSLSGDRASADDLVQETIVKALANRDKFQEGTNFTAWLITILRNHFYSVARKRRREIEDADDKFALRVPDAPRQDGHIELLQFAAALNKVPEEQREALILVGASGFSYEQAAEICGVRTGTIKSRVSRARAMLQDYMASEATPRDESAAVRQSALVGE